MNGLGPQLEPPTPPRRKHRAWVIAAPITLVVVTALLFNAVGKSCVVKHCSPAANTKKQSATSSTAANKRLMYRVTQADSMGQIAAKFGLTIDEIKACNPNVDPNALQVGQKLRVDKAFCKKAYENAPI